jgi:hypothetical protein
MKRRSFIGTVGASACLAFGGAAPSFAKKAGSPPRLETPEERADYTKRLLDELCEHGPRPAGSKACIEGGRIIKREMERSLRQVELDWYTFTMWEPVGKTEFLLGFQPIETWPFYAAQSPPPEGLRGVLKKTGEKAFVIADASGKTIADLFFNEYGRAIPHSLDPDKPGLPKYGIGKQDIPLFEQAERLSLPVSVKSGGRFRPNTRSCSVIGRLPGKTADEIFVVAHSDTEYNAPGANDNTASAIVLILLAHASAVMTPNLSLTFMAADGEECGFLGAKHYAARREADGTMKNIRLALNFDSLTYGPNLQVYGKDEALVQMVKDIHRDLAIGTAPEYFNDSDFVMDSEPFQSSGGKALYFNSRGYNEKTLPVYHRPEDVPLSVPLDCVESSFLVLRELIRRVGM